MFTVSKKFRDYMKVDPRKFIIGCYLEMYTNYSKEEWMGNKQFEVSFYPRLVIETFKNIKLKRSELEDIVHEFIELGYFEMVNTEEGRITLKNLLAEERANKYNKKDD